MFDITPDGLTVSDRPIPGRYWINIVVLGSDNLALVEHKISIVVADDSDLYPVFDRLWIEFDLESQDVKMDGSNITIDLPSPRVKKGSLMFKTIPLEIPGLVVDSLTVNLVD